MIVNHLGGLMGPWAGASNLRFADLSKEGMRKVAAQEIDSIEGLRRIYSNVMPHISYINDSS